MRRVGLFIFVLSFSSLFSCRPPINDLLKAHAPFSSPNLYYLSPLHGAVGAEGNFLKKILLYGDTRSAINKLLKTLFVIEEGGEFFPTSYNPYTRFTPKTISLLVAKAYANNLFERDELNRYAAIKEIAKTYSGDKSPKRVSLVIDLIHASLQEEAPIEKKMNRYFIPPGTTYQILLAFLYLQSHTSEALQDYTGSTCAQLGLGQKKLSSFESNLLYNNKDAWQSSPHCIIIQKLLEKNVPQCNPPRIQWKRNIVYKNNKPISNCCETAVAALINELLFNPTTKRFDLSCIASRPGVSSSLVAYYNQYNTSESLQEIDSLEAHAKWLEVVSNLPNVGYRKTQYELEPGIFNILHCVATLFGITLPNDTCSSQKQTLKKICKKISKIGPTTLKPLLAHVKKNDRGSVQFELTKNSYKRTSFTFHLFARKNHAWFKHESPSRDTNPSLLDNGSSPVTFSYLIARRLKEQWNECLKPHPIFYDIAALYAFYLLEIPELHERLLLNLDTDTEFQKQYCFRKVVDVYRKSQNPIFYLYLLDLINSMTDSKKLCTCLCYLIFLYADRSEVQQVFENKLKLLSYDEQQTLMMRCAQKKLWKIPFYKNFLIKALLAIKNFENNETIMIDSKVFTLQKMALYDADESPAIKSALEILINGLGEARLERYKKGLRYARSHNKISPPLTIVNTAEKTI